MDQSSEQSSLFTRFFAENTRIRRKRRPRPVLVSPDSDADPLNESNASSSQFASSFTSDGHSDGEIDELDYIPPGSAPTATEPLFCAVCGDRALG